MVTGGDFMILDIEGHSKIYIIYYNRELKANLFENQEPIIISKIGMTYQNTTSTEWQSTLLSCVLYQKDRICSHTSLNKIFHSPL